MSFINYFLTSLVAFSGLIFGVIVARAAVEEMNDGKKYFVLLQKAVLVGILFVLLYYFNVPIILAIIIAFVFGALLHFHELQPKVVYPFLAVVFALSYGTQKLFFLESVLIFIYGFPMAALNVKRSYWRFILENSTFLVVSLLLFTVYLLR